MAGFTGKQRPVERISSARRSDTTGRRTGGEDPRPKDIQSAWGSGKARVSLTISIVIPALNEAAGIAEAIDRAWETGPDEVIVVDGHSGDETFRVAQARRCRAMLGPRGRASQQNVGAAEAKGDVLLFLHADNWLDPGGVEQIRAALADPVVPAGAFRQRIDAPGGFYRALERGNAFRAARLGRPFGDQGIFVRRALFQQLGGFPELALMEDVFLMKQLRQHGRPVLLKGPIHVSARRWRKNGVVRQTLKNWTLLGAARLGISPNILARWYRPHEPESED